MTPPLLELLRPLAADAAITHVRHPMWKQLSLCSKKMYPAIISRGPAPTCKGCRRRLELSETILATPTTRRRAPTSRPAPMGRAELELQRAFEELGDLEPDLVDVDLRCTACEGFDRRELAGDEKLSDVLEALVCQHCGARGRFMLAPAIAEEPLERPAHPEEP